MKAAWFKDSDGNVFGLVQLTYLHGSLSFSIRSAMKACKKVPYTGCLAHDEQHPASRLAALDPCVGSSCLLQRGMFGDRRRT